MDGEPEELGDDLEPAPVAEVTAVPPEMIKRESLQRFKEGETIIRQGDPADKFYVIIEGFVDFDYEITLLTVRHKAGTSYCEPIGHVQKVQRE